LSERIPAIKVLLLPKDTNALGTVDEQGRPTPVLG
jgi:hypothetical protein